MSTFAQSLHSEADQDDRVTTEVEHSADMASTVSTLDRINIFGVGHLYKGAG